MFNDKMDIDDMIKDLSTRATNYFCNTVESDYVSVVIQAHENYPDCWQAWFVEYSGDKIIFNDQIKHVLSDATTLRQALIGLDSWFDDEFVKKDYSMCRSKQLEQESSDIIESIGFAD